MKKFILIAFLLTPIFCVSQTNSVVTELYLANNFTPKSGITPGSNNTLAMDCNQITTRYNVQISGVTTSGNRCPSQNEIIAFYECGGTASFSGGYSYPSYFKVNLGTATGTVTVNYNMYNAPDLMVVYFDGTVVAHTGFRGNSYYDYGGTYRAEFNSTLNGRYYPDTGTLLPDATLWVQDGYPRLIGSGAGSVNFSKSTSTNYCEVYVYAPMANTVWSILVGCPE